MTNGWTEYKLGEIAEINPRVSLKQGQVYSFVEMKDLNPSLKYVEPAVSKELKGGAKFQEGDTLFARITPCLENGKICQVKGLTNEVGFGSTEFLVFRGKPEVSDTDFIYYLTRSDDVRSQAIQAMTGTSGRQRVEKSALEKIAVQIPHLDTQREIAGILSAFDDKIELNRRMNQTLETIAQTLFTEWFVRFNFPGFDGKLVDGLPKGWRMGTLGEIYKTTSGGTPSRAVEDFYQNGTIKWVKSKELNGSFIFDTEEHITNQALKNSSAKLLPRHSFLIAMYGATVGEYGILSDVATCNQAICAVIPNNDYPYTYFVEYFKSNRLQIINQAIGSAQQNISQALIQKLEIMIPDIGVLADYHSIVEDIFKKVEINLTENQTLTQLRDSLLPRLLSGQIQFGADA